MNTEDNPNNRVSWPERMMRLAGWWSQWGTCRRLMTGAVAVTSDFQVLASGYNGSPRGLEHCRGRAEAYTDPNRHCLTCLHAEANCILQAARTGVSLRRATVFVTHRPCIRCATQLVQLGVAGIFYHHDYDSDGALERVRQLCKDGGVAFVAFPREG